MPAIVLALASALAYGVSDYAAGLAIWPGMDDYSRNSP